VSDVHTLTWTLSDSSLMGETDNTSASFSSDNIPDGEYTVAVVATDNRYSPLSDDASITFTVERNASSAPENSTSSGSSGGGGALGVFWVLMLAGLMRLRSRRSNIPS
jgi:MYXO-CTERM domain-containing protein